MLKLGEENNEILNLLNAKLVKDYSKISKKVNKPSKNEKLLNALEYGTDDNRYLIGTSAAMFGFPLAIGLSSAVLGMISLVPLADQTVMSNVTQAAIDLEKFGEKAILFGGELATRSLPLIAIPIGVTSLSLSVKLYQMLKENKKEKNKFNYAMINFINDVLDDKDDETLDLSKKIFKRVDLSSLTPKENIKLIKYLTYHRMLLKQYEMGNINEEDIDEAYGYIILYLEKLRNSKNANNNLKNNRFVNLLIYDYHKKEYEEFILSEHITK